MRHKVLSKKEIEHIAMLARLFLTEAEKDLFRFQLSSILDYMDKLNELDTKDVEPTSNVISLNNVMREDIPKDSIPREEILFNAPDRTEKFFRVPKIID
jgi:aspartyl-tRNA(Asn)/glutamyl-tRNA(Gln) amidotransferase subunit C